MRRIASLKRSLKSLTVLLLLSWGMSAYAQKGKEGTATLAGTSSPNTYTRVTASVAAGATAVQIESLADLNGTSFSGALAAGDLVFLYQAQGAFVAIQESSSKEHETGSVSDQASGAVTSIGNCGNYEFLEVLSVSGNTVTFTCPLVNDYDVTGNTQLIRVPRYQDLTVNGTLTGSEWDGEKGGVVVLEIEENLVVDGSVDASGIGFRGGQITLNGNPGGGRRASALSTEGVQKGEGIAGFGAVLPTLGVLAQYCKGAIANGGGGGNGQNGGGGGGGNGGNLSDWNGYGNADATYNAYWGLESPSISGNTSSGGGRGGYTGSLNQVDPSANAPGDGSWADDRRRVQGGFGGRPLGEFYTQGKLFLGGGGGAGDNNVSEATDGSDGGNGGGLIFVLTYGSVSGGGVIRSNGNDGEDAYIGGSSRPLGYSGDDGAGGAGAGGTIILHTSGGMSGVSIEAIGGDGGNNNLYNNNSFTPGTYKAQGPGGGGGGGYVSQSGGALAVDVSGGVNGVTDSETMVNFPPNGATSGGGGSSGTSISIIPTFTTNGDAVCVGETGTVSVNEAGTYNWYDSPAGGNLLHTGSSFTSGALTEDTAFYVSKCPGWFRERVEVDVEEKEVIDLTFPGFCGATSLAPIEDPGHVSGGVFSIVTPTGDGSSIDANTGIASGLQDGTTYTIKYVTPGTVGCKDSATFDISPGQPEDIALTFSSFCGQTSEAPVEGSGHTAGGVYSIVAPTGDGSSIDASTGVISNAQTNVTYTVKYVTPGTVGCKDSATFDVEGEALEEVDLTYADYCGDEIEAPTEGANHVSGGVFSIVAPLGDVASINASTGVVSGLQAGGTIYTIKYVTPGTSGCKDSAEFTVSPGVFEVIDLTFSSYCGTTSNAPTEGGGHTGGGVYSLVDPTGGPETIDPATGIISNIQNGTVYTIQYRTPGTVGCQDSLEFTMSNAGAGNEDIDFTYGDLCGPDLDSPVEGATHTSGGTYAFVNPPDALAQIDPATGAITNAQAGASYEISYTTPICNIEESSTIQVRDYPEVDFSYAVFCEGDNPVPVLGANHDSGGAYALSSSSPNTITVDANTGLLSGGAAGENYEITYEITQDGCTRIDTADAFCNFQDTIDVAYTDFCGDTVLPVLGATHITGGMFSFVGSSGSAIVDPVTGKISNATAGESYTIQYTSPNKYCPNIATFTVQALSQHVVDFSYEDACENDQILPTEGNGHQAGGTYTLDVTSPDVATVDPTTGEITGAVAGGTYVVLYTSPAGDCQTTGTATCTVNTLEQIAFEMSDFCGNVSEEATLLSGHTSGGVFSIVSPALTQETIDPVTGKISNAIIGLQYQVQYTSPGVTCQNSEIVQILSTPGPTIDLTYPDTLCDFETANPVAGVNHTAGGTFSFSAGSSTLATLDPTTGILTNVQEGETYLITYSISESGCTVEQEYVLYCEYKGVVDFSYEDFCADEVGIPVVGTTQTPGGLYGISAPVGGGGATIDSETGQLSGVTAGVEYTIFYVTSGACQTTSAQTVTVSEPSPIGITYADFCETADPEVVGDHTVGGVYALLGPDDGASLDPATGQLTGATDGVEYQIAYSTENLKASGLVTCAQTQVFTATKLEEPTISIAGDEVVCDEGIVELEATSNADVEWMDDTQGNLWSGLVSATTWVSAKATNNCGEERDSIEVRVVESPVLDMPEEMNVIIGEPVELTANDGMSFIWSPSNGVACTTCETTEIVATEDMTYSLIAFSEEGCSDTAEVRFIVDNNSVHFVPTGFSPNGDGWNDELYVYTRGVKTLWFAVFDRWGNKVFETFNAETGWDGMYKGKEVNTSVFVYKLFVEYYDGREFEQSGNITLVK